MLGNQTLGKWMWLTPKCPASIRNRIYWPFIRLITRVAQSSCQQHCDVHVIGIDRYDTSQKLILAKS